MTAASCHDEGGATTAVQESEARFALVGSPNAGKTSVFNALTGLHAKTGNYPGVTVSRYVGTCRAGSRRYAVEDLPGTYSLEPISPDEQIVTDVLDGSLQGVQRPDAVLAVLDATTLRRSLGFLAQVLARGLPTCVVITFTDELARRQGALDTDALARALGVPVVPVVAHRGEGLDHLRDRLSEWTAWSGPVVPPPTDAAETDAWIESVLTTAGYRAADRHRASARIDAVLLHPVWGTLTFFAVMFAFFQAIFTVAAPMQDAVESFFAWCSALVADNVANPWAAGLLGEAVIGGVGGVLVFIPQIMVLFLLIALMEGVGYMPRAAFLMDRVMARAGLEGRAFVALLSSFACAIPGIMATRTLPSARERLATMMGAPLMTCSARLPVYVLLIGMIVKPEQRVGPFGAQGTIMFGLYVLGAVSAMTAAWFFKRLGDRRGVAMPFYMELPPYRVPGTRTVLLSVWQGAKAFLVKVSTIILITTVALWLLLNLPAHSVTQMRDAGVDTTNDVAVSAYTVENSYAADLGRFVSPVFEPLGFDWRINVGVLSSLSARETFVATLGQVAAAQDPENPTTSLESMRVAEGPRAGEKVFTPGTLAALLVFFVYALQCMSTIGILRRETGTWKWPLVAFTYMFALAWTAALLARTLTDALVA